MQKQQEAAWVREVVTTAGDAERESKSRLFNGLEALGVMLFVLVNLWVLSYLAGVMGGVPGMEGLSVGLLTLGALYILFVAPFIHRDTLNSWGLGNPRVLWRMLSSGPMGKRAALAAIVLALFAALNYANYSQWHEVAKFFHFKGTVLANAKDSLPGLLFMFLFGSTLATIIITCAIRYDNFLPAFRTALMVSLPLLALTFIAAYLHRGTEAFAQLSLSKWSLGVLGYVFWGFTQQLLFSSYFGTRFRKALGPSTSPTNVVPGAERPAVIVVSSAAFSAGAFLLSWVGLNTASNGEAGVPLGFPIAIALFAIPGGAAYGYFFCLDKKRLLAATFAASCFGLIHLVSYGLVAVTWGLGIILVYVFMEDKNRNLVALGFIHGLLGSTFGSLFSKGESGLLEIDYSVGPTHVDVPTLAVAIIPLVCVGLYMAAAAWFVSHVDER